MMHKKTDEEKFLFKAYEIASKLGDDYELDALEIGNLLGQRKHKVKITLLHLARSGFIKKVGESSFILTAKAFNLIESMK